METAPGLYSMGQSMGGNVHAFLLDDGKELTLIDSLFDADAYRSHLSGAQVYAHEWEADIIAGERPSQPVSLWPQPTCR